MSHISGRAGWWKPPSPVLVRASGEQSPGATRQVRLKADADTQTLEDVICLVFLEHYLPAFATQHDDAKLVDILRKTWRKMSERGRSAALQLDLAPEIRTLVEKAIG